MLDKTTAAPTKTIPEPLFIFELANNHMGDIDHGLRVVAEFGALAREFDFNFAFKLQFRELDTFIHPAFKDRTDIKYIKRFSQTRLDRDATRRLVAAIKAEGFLAMCTPFDEASVDRIVEDGFDILKIASCSFTDWPLLEKIASVDLPIIGSTAGIECADMDNVRVVPAPSRQGFRADGLRRAISDAERRPAAQPDRRAEGSLSQFAHRLFDA